MSVNKLLSIGLIAFISLFATPVPNDYEYLLAQLEKQDFDYAQEKIYLHLDKPYYAPGSNLWFKAYAVAGPKHLLSPLSQNLYVELIDPGAKVIARHNIFMEKGLGQGDFKLADSLRNGTYTLRAYTNWMRNFDEDFFFKRNIELVSRVTEATGQAEKTSVSKIQFFPEGGELIANVPVQVAFETNSLEASGVILDDNGIEVARFQANEEGLGKFGITPMAGAKYKARLEGETKEFELPEVRAAGLALSVDNLRDDDFVWVMVKTAESAPLHEAFLVVHTRGVVSFGSKLEWKGAFARVKIPKANIQAGVVHLTLFNMDWMPVAERLIFQHQDDKAVQLRVTRNKESYTKRQETALRIKVIDEDGIPVKGFFSLTAFDQQQLSPDFIKDHIQSSLLLTSDLKGLVNNPAQYFGDDKAQTAKQLDMLMMTKGWRRFIWRDLLSDQFPEIRYPVEQGFNVSGRVTQGNRGKKGVSNAKIKQLGMFNGAPSFREARTDEEGYFEMKNLYYYENDGVVRATGKRDKGNVGINLKKRQLSLAQKQVDLPDRPTVWDPSLLAAYLKKNDERNQIARAYGELAVTYLGEVVVEESAAEKARRNLERGMTYNQSQYGFNVTDLMSTGRRYINALYLLQGQVPGVTISMGSNGEPVVNMSRASVGFNQRRRTVSFFIDDAQVPASAVSAMPAEMVERVEIVKGNQASAVMGGGWAGGVFYYTKTKQDWERYYDILLENGVIVDQSNRMLPEGYYRNRQFYKTTYDRSTIKQPKPDYRDLIHWEPMIETNELGEAIVRFFNADLPTSIQVNVEGLTEEGRPLIATMSYQVRD